MSRLSKVLRQRWLELVVCILLALGAREAWMQREEDAFIRSTALRVVHETGAETARDRVIALRDYVRRTVTWRGAPTGTDPRPFLRSTAAETLRSGRGYCGEDSRAFINLARSIGIEAQRVNLYGSMMHVVAEVELVPHQRLIVDAQSPPTIVDLEPLDEVILRPEFDDYYTLNLRRLHLGSLVSRIRFEMGPLTYWLENPHALSGLLFVLAACVMASGRLARFTLRHILLRRGWVHRSTLERELRVAADADARTSG